MIAWEMAEVLLVYASLAMMWRARYGNAWDLKVTQQRASEAHLREIWEF